MGLIESGESFLEPITPSSIEIDDRANSGFIHLGQVATDGGGSEPILAPAQVVMNVDYWIERFLHNGDFCHHHRLGLPIAELQIPDVFSGLRATTCSMPREKNRAGRKESGSEEQKSRVH